MFDLAVKKRQIHFSFQFIASQLQRTIPHQLMARKMEAYNKLVHRLETVSMDEENHDDEVSRINYVHLVESFAPQ